MEADKHDDDRIVVEAPRHTFLWALLSGWLLAAEAWLRSHGGKPLQFSIRGFWALVSAGGLFLLLGPVINPPLSLDDITDSASTATDTWIARDFAADYRISTDDDGTLLAHVEERITAFFGDKVEETGIERQFATSYQNHELLPSDFSVTHDGEPVEFESTLDNGLRTITVDSGEILTGDHDYVISYTLRNLAYESTDDASGDTVDLLEWDVLGPSWPHAFAALDVTITIPEALDDKLIRQPRGSIAWTILGAGSWLEPEEDSPGGYVSYIFSNEQNIPPHANAWFTMSFENGTFTMPPPSQISWLQLYGPLIPLGFLVVTLLLAIAARAVAWADARGRPWYSAESRPPKKVSPRLAAHLLRAPLGMELAEALAKAHGPATKLAAARVARRTGRLGDLLWALTRYSLAREGRQQQKLGLRRIPHGFVRDLFIGAPIALTLVQWGIVRQLSHQAKLSIVWWPVAFVFASTLVAVIVLLIALTARPLTEKGALIKQHLLGMDVFADRVQLLDRGPSSDPAVPYAVLFSPRDSAKRVLSLLESELPGKDLLRGWRTADYVSWQRITLRILSAVVVVAAFVVTISVPAPYWMDRDGSLMYSWDLPGADKAKVLSFDARAELSRSGSGQALLDVTQRLVVEFDGTTSRVPQFAQQWPSRLSGQDLGLKIESVTIDGEAVKHELRADGDALLMVTQLQKIMTGTHEVQIDYSLESAAYAAEGMLGGTVDRVKWSALLDGWEYNRSWGDEPLIDPLRYEITLSKELAEHVLIGGWNTKDTSGDGSARDWPDYVVPFGNIRGLFSPGSGDDSADPATVTNESRDESSSRVTYALELRKGSISYPAQLTWNDLGATFDFAPGTFVGPDEEALAASDRAVILPLLVTLAAGIIATGLGVLGIVLFYRRQSRPILAQKGLVRDLVVWLAPSLALVTCILFVWLSLDTAASHWAITPTLLAAGASLTASIWGLVVAGYARNSPHTK